jgi:hypothetical protein
LLGGVLYALAPALPGREREGVGEFLASARRSCREWASAGPSSDPRPSPINYVDFSRRFVFGKSQNMLSYLQGCYAFPQTGWRARQLFEPIRRQKIWRMMIFGLELWSSSKRHLPSSQIFVGCEAHGILPAAVTHAAVTRGSVSPSAYPSMSSDFRKEIAPVLYRFGKTLHPRRRDLSSESQANLA